MPKRKTHYFCESNVIKDSLARDQKIIKRCIAQDNFGGDIMAAIFLPEQIAKVFQNDGRKKALALLNKLNYVAKYAPQNFDIYGLLEPNTDLEYIKGDFCTFDYNLAKLKNAAPKKLYAYINQTCKDSISANSKKIANDIFALLKHPRNAHDLQSFKKNDNVDNYSKFFTKMAKKLAQERKIEDYVNVKVIENWNEAPKYARPVVNEFDITKAHYLKTSIANKPNKEFLEIYICKRSMFAKTKDDLFFKILESFAHEFGHYIDSVAPNRGGLGAQAIAYCAWPKPKSHKEYLEIPTEKSSHKIQSEMMNLVKKYYSKSRGS